MRFVRFNVTGRFMFPIDMLRHDQCFPLTPSDSGAIEDSMTVRNKQGYTVQLGAYLDNPYATAHAARWESFGWRVDQDSIEFE